MSHRRDKFTASFWESPPRLFRTPFGGWEGAPTGVTPGPIREFDAGLAVTFCKTYRILPAP